MRPRIPECERVARNAERENLILAFDFEWANKNLFFGQYARVGSYFEGTELAAPQALPQDRELEILNEVKDEVPPEVFTTVAFSSARTKTGSSPSTSTSRRCTEPAAFFCPA